MFRLRFGFLTPELSLPKTLPHSKKKFAWDLSTLPKAKNGQISFMSFASKPNKKFLSISVKHLPKRLKLNSTAALSISLSDADLGSLPCWTQELCLIVNKRHPLAKQNTVSLNDLKGHYLISYDLNEPLGKTLASLIDGKPLQVGYRYKDEITLASIVLANPDVMALSCQSWLLKAYTDEVRFLSVEEAPKDFRQLYIVYRLSALQNEAVCEFLELAKELFLPSKF